MSQSSIVLVTGANGYVALWLVKRLLDAGFRVHATVRDLSDGAKTKVLSELVPAGSDQLRIFEADLLREGSFSDAMEGCDCVFHTASPFMLQVRDNQRDLIDPALEGTRNILQCACSKATVQRVILTSSVAAVMGDTADLLELPHHTADERHWNHSSTLTHQPYSYSKTLAEREAWRIANGQSRWKLVVINPVLVIGPGLNSRATSESFQIVRQLGDGTLKWGVPHLDFGLVDVRDVAEAHYQAAIRIDAEGRHILSAGHFTLLEMAEMVRAATGNRYKLPTCTLPKWLVWLMAPAVGISRRMVRRNVGYPWLVDNQKSIRQLGIQYRPVKESLVAHFQQVFNSSSGCESNAQA